MFLYQGTLGVTGHWGETKMLQYEDNQRGDGVCVERATVDHCLSHFIRSSPVDESRSVHCMYSTYQYIKLYTLLWLYILRTYYAQLHVSRKAKTLPSFPYLTLTNR
mgnify:FL=1